MDQRKDYLELEKEPPHYSCKGTCDPKYTGQTRNNPPEKIPGSGEGNNTTKAWLAMHPYYKKQ